MTGMADAKTGTASLWFNAQAFGSGVYIFSNNAYFYIERQSSNKIRIVGLTSGGSVILRLNCNTAISSAGWHHFMASWDLGAATGHLYLDGTDDSVTPTLVDGTIDYTRGQWALGAQTTGTAKFNGGIADFFFHNTYIDLSNSANRLKFRDVAGKPVYLGSTGSIPLGVQPIAFFTNALASWHTNVGSGGGYTENGALTAFGSSPSD